MSTRVLSQQARDLYRAAYPIGPTLGSTTFAAWMREVNMPAREIAVKLGCTELSVRSWAAGRRVPTIELARRIEMLTGIPIASWVEIKPANDNADPTGR
jgi:hypothetical protein